MGVKGSEMFGEEVSVWVECVFGGGEEKWKWVKEGRRDLRRNEDKAVQEVSSDEDVAVLKR